MKSGNRTALFAACVFAGLMFSGTGCGQKTKGWFGQASDQATKTSTDQDAATAGSQVYVYVVNAPGKDGLPKPGDFQAGSENAEVQTGAVTDTVENAAGGNGIKSARAGYVQAGLTITVNTGSTTPSLTGSATNSASQTPSATSTQSPTQDVRPETSASMPVAVAMPGGMNDQQSTVAAKGSTANPAKTSENQVTYTQIKALADKVEQLTKLLDALPKGGTTQTPPPVTPEIPGEPQESSEEASGDGAGS